MNIKLAFFDIDGTLIHRVPGAGVSLKSASMNYALEKVLGLKDVNYLSILGKRAFGLTDKAILKFTITELGFDEGHYYDSESALFEAIDYNFERNRDRSRVSEYHPNPGIFDLLSILKRKHVRLGLVTGNIKKHSDWKMKGAGFDGYFTTGAFGNDSEHRWEILSIAIERNSDIPVSQICHFGDSPSDLEAARHCGIKGVTLDEAGGGTHSRHELETVGFGLVVDNWAETEKIESYLSS